MKYDIHSVCPLCNKSIQWLNGKTNYGVVIIKTKRKSTDLYHEKCFDEYRKQNRMVVK